MGKIEHILSTKEIINKMDYKSKTCKELISICKEKRIKGYSGKKKDDLILLLEKPSVIPITEEKEIIKNISPLRYPGGKTRAISILEDYVTKYFPEKDVLLSPFFGGGSFELFMTTKGFTIKANDLFDPLYIFWKIKQSDCDSLVSKIKEFMPVSKEKFIDFRKKIMTEEDEITKAAYYYLINRTSFSGATLCGGFSKQAAEKRLTTSSIERLKDCDVSSITFSNYDCIDFLKYNPETKNTIVYGDPPYYIETYIYGKDGDMHETFNHVGFAEEIKKRKDYIISYNDCKFIRDLYKDCRIFKVNWAYGMNAKKTSSEILIIPPIS